MNIEFLDLNEENCGLLCLIELPDYLYYLFKINVRQ
jgi:hypothetical protein